MKSITNKPIIALAPSHLRETYFANLYQTIAMEAENHQRCGVANAGARSEREIT
jgi:hypothetical protein